MVLHTNLPISNTSGFLIKGVPTLSAYCYFIVALFDIQKQFMPATYSRNSNLNNVLVSDSPLILCLSNSYTTHFLIFIFNGLFTIIFCSG